MLHELSDDRTHQENDNMALVVPGGEPQGLEIREMGYGIEGLLCCSKDFELLYSRIRGAT